MIRFSITKVLIGIAIFVLSYAVFLLLWFPIKGYYGASITIVSSYLVSLVEPLDYLKVFYGSDDTVTAVFRSGIKCTRNDGPLMLIPIETSFYAFNLPLTLAIMMVVFYVIKMKKPLPYLGGIVFLVFTHLSYVFLLEMNETADYLVKMGCSGRGFVALSVYQFLWLFFNNMVVRLEPVLIGIFLVIYTRFDKYS